MTSSTLALPRTFYTSPSPMCLKVAPQEQTSLTRARAPASDGAAEGDVACDGMSPSDTTRRPHRAEDRAGRLRCRPQEHPGPEQDDLRLGHGRNAIPIHSTTPSV